MKKIFITFFGLFLANTASAILPEDKLFSAITQADEPTITNLLKGGLVTKKIDPNISYNGFPMLQWAIHYTFDRKNATKAKKYNDKQTELESRLNPLELLLNAGANPLVNSQNEGLDAITFLLKTPNAAAYKLSSEDYSYLIAKIFGKLIKKIKTLQLSISNDLKKKWISLINTNKDLNNDASSKLLKLWRKNMIENLEK